MFGNSPRTNLSNPSRRDSGYGGSRESSFQSAPIPMEVDGTGRRSLAASVNHALGNGWPGAQVNGNRQSGDLVVTAGISLGSPVAQRRGAPGNLSTSVTQVINGGSPDPGSVSATLLRPASGNGEGTRSRANFTAGPMRCPGREVLGVVTIGDDKDEEVTPDVQPQPEPQPQPRPQPRPQPQPCPQRMQIFVKNLNGKILKFDVLASDTVYTLMLQIKEETGMPIDQQRLQYAGKNLESGLTLGYYQIKEGSTIFMQGRLRGG